MVRGGFVGGFVDERLRERLVAGIEKSMLAVGAGSYTEGIQTARRLFARIYEDINRIQTVEDLRNILDECPPVSKLEAATALFVVNHLAQLVRIGLKFAAEKAVSTLPATNRGRPPAIPSNKVGEVLDYVSQLHRKGCTFEVAVSRAKLKFGVSERTIERLWAKRDSVTDDESLQVSMGGAVEYIAGSGSAR